MKKAIYYPFTFQKPIVDDRNMDFKEFLTKNIFGKTFADRDFIFQMITDYL
jgi:hypothetical protein